DCRQCTRWPGPARHVRQPCQADFATIDRSGRARQGRDAGRSFVKSGEELQADCPTAPPRRTRAHRDSLGRRVGRRQPVSGRVTGIPVRNVPDYCTEEVSDHALALLLAAERRLTAFAELAASGQWDVVGRPENESIRRLRGQTLGILGAGRIGSKVARKARAFGFRTIAFDPYISSTEDPEIELVPLPDLLGQADALVLCASLNDGSRGLLGWNEFAQLRPGVILVNVARGALIDEAALAEALGSGRVGLAALDVRSPEPPAKGADPLAGLPNVI